MWNNSQNFNCINQNCKGEYQLKYQRIISNEDGDIPYISSVMKLPEISRYISIDEKNYWQYVTSNDNVFYFKVYDNNGHLVAATHCETVKRTLYMYIMVMTAHQRKGIATSVLRDIQCDKLPLEFDQIEVSIDSANTASIKLFEKMNFQYVSKEEELLNYIYKKF